MSEELYISELLSKLEGTDNRDFEPENGTVPETQFYEVGYNHEYDPGPYWENSPGFEELPWIGSRNKARIPASNFDRAIFSVEPQVKQLSDFYTVGGGGTYLISDKLRKIIEELAPVSLDKGMVELPKPFLSMPYWLCMPKVLIEAVDASRSRVAIKYKGFDTFKMRRIQFPSGVKFSEARTAGLLHFGDIDLRAWYWSRELIQSAEEAGVIGLAYRTAGRECTRRVSVSTILTDTGSEL